MDKKEYIQSKIRDIKDFPKEGIIFKDITPLLMDVKGVEYVIDLLVENLKGQKVDKVVGMESRGFFFGMLLAQRGGKVSRTTWRRYNTTRLFDGVALS